MANDLNKEMINEVERYMHIPKHMNEVNKKLLEDGIVDLNNQDERDKFFVNAMRSHNDEEVYSGKIIVPAELLNKKGMLSSEEFEIIKRHLETSYQILKSIDEYWILQKMYCIIMSVSMAKII